MMKFFDRSWLAIVMLLTVAALPVRTHATTPTIVFSEIAWAGSSISASDEWIELTNVGDEAVDLSGWTLTGAGSSEANLVLPDGSIAQPHSTFLIANYELAHENTALAVTANYVTASLSLPNGGFNLHLSDDGGSLIDVAGGAGAPFAGRSGSTADSDGRYASMVRVDGLSDGSLAESWSDADASQGFLDEIQDYGTPGIVSFGSSVIQSETSEASEAEGSPNEEILEEEPTEEVVVEELDEETFVEEIVEEPVVEEALVGIRISEFVVDPHEGEAEWIELANMSDEPVDLTGWTVEDAVGKQTALESTIAAGGYLLIEAPLGKLNNDTDSILLKDATGTIIDSVAYGTDELVTPKDGAALARGASGSFELTYATTPGGVNLIDPKKPEVVESTQEEVAEEIIETEDNVSTVIPSEAEGSQVTDSGQSDAFVNIRISEFVVDPVGDGVEWIELYNTGDTLTLDSWTIEDASGKATDLTGITMDAGAYLVIESPKGKLNNDGDMITLKDSTGAVVESLAYGGEGYTVPKNGNSLARNGEGFEITQQPTPGSANLIFVALESVEDVKEVEDNTSSSVIPPAHQSLGDGGTKVVNLKTLRFVTLYPNTTGSDETEEYIEIQNIGDAPVDLLDWMLEDGSTDRFTMKDSLVIDVGETTRLIRTQTKITLNNGGDTLELIAPDETVVDKVTYGNAAKGETYNLVDDKWQWSGTMATIVEVTPATNSSATSTTSSTNTSSQTTTSSASYASAMSNSRVTQSLTVEQAKSKADGSQVSIKGTVTAVPGVFGSQIFYLADDTGGIQIYLYSGDFPELTVGDGVSVTGELSTSHGERRVKLSGATGVVPASGSLERVASSSRLDQIDTSMVGSLMTIEGLIQSKSSTKLVLEDSGATLTIYLKSNPAIDPNQFERGDKLEVTGILTTYDGELRLRPRTVADITVEEEAVVSTAITTPTTDSNSGAGLILLYSTMAALALLALWRYVPRRRLTPAAV